MEERGILKTYEESFAGSEGMINSVKCFLKRPSKVRATLSHGYDKVIVGDLERICFGK